MGFFLAFGPGLVRAVERCRVRFDVVWQPAVPVLVAVAAALAVAPAGARAEEPSVARAARLAAGRPEPRRRLGRGARGSSSDLYGAWAAIGLAAAGRPVASAALRGADGARATTADLERAILALAAAGEPLRAPARRLLAAQRADGSFGGLVNVTSFGVLALRAAGGAPRRRRGPPAGSPASRTRTAAGASTAADRPAGSTTALRRCRPCGGAAAGSWNRRALAFLRRAQRPDGGFPLVPGRASNAQSTAFAVQALVALGADPKPRRGRGRAGPARAPARLQARDGSVRYSRTSAQTPVWVTAQALAALARRPSRWSPGAPAARGAAALCAFLRL